MVYRRGIATERKSIGTEEYDAADSVMTNIEGFAGFTAYRAAEDWTWPEWGLRRVISIL